MFRTESDCPLTNQWPPRPAAAASTALLLLVGGRAKRQPPTRARSGDKGEATADGDESRGAGAGGDGACPIDCSHTVGQLQPLTEPTTRERDPARCSGTDSLMSVIKPQRRRLSQGAPKGPDSQRRALGHKSRLGHSDRDQP